MRKLLIPVLLCMLLAVSGAQAAGGSLKTLTPFADMDFAAQGYMDMITRWEAETGNLAEDYSGMPDELFMENLRAMIREGTADVVVLPVGSGLTASELLTADELAADTDCGVRRMEAMREQDGSVLLAPVGGRLGDSIAALTAGASDMTGVLYDHHPDSFDSWAEGVMAKLMGK